jgi:hypothetical protein
VHRAIGNRNELAALAQLEQGKLLADPQALNSYGYGRSNPLRYKDPTGNCFEFFSALACVGAVYSAAQLGATGMNLGVTNGEYGEVFSDAERSRTRFAAGYQFGTTVLGLAAPGVGLPTVGYTLEALSAVSDVEDTYLGQYIYKRYNENHEDELQGVFKTAKELKPTSADKARYQIGLNGSGAMSPMNANSAIFASQSNQSRSYSFAVSSLTKIRDTLSALVTKLSAGKGTE